MSDHKKLIWAEDAIEALTDDLSYYGAGNEAAYGMSRAIGIIEKLPPAQPEIIQCKDCLMHGVCRFEQGLGLDGYCSQAERRQDGKTD